RFLVVEVSDTVGVVVVLERKCGMKPKMARKPRPTDEVSSPPLSPTSGGTVHKKRRIESESVSPERKMSTSSNGDTATLPRSPKFSPPKEVFTNESEMSSPLSPLPPLILDDQQACSSNAPATAIEAPPEFLAFNYKALCPALMEAVKSEEMVPQMDREKLRDLQYELEAMLAHTMDFMRRAAGDLQFLEKGEYPTVNLKKREMPVFQLRVPLSPMSPNTLMLHEMSLRAQLIPSHVPDDDPDEWPAPHFPSRYQSWLLMEKEEDAIDEHTLDQFEDFIDKEIEELGMEYVKVNVPEFRHRLHHSNTLEMFNAIEQRLANTSMEQLNIRQNRRTITYDGESTSSVRQDELVSISAAASFTKNYRDKYDMLVTERRMSMLKITQLPSLGYPSLRDRREERLRKENRELKKQLMEARKIADGAIGTPIEEKNEEKKKDETKDKEKSAKDKEKTKPQISDKKDEREKKTLFLSPTTSMDIDPVTEEPSLSKKAHRPLLSPTASIDSESVLEKPSSSKK
ncbi:hypothetical protein PRIPAC_80931, partial [Pristionchus pacificus]